MDLYVVGEVTDSGHMEIVDTNGKTNILPSGGYQHLGGLNMKKEAILYKKIDGKAHCNVCQRRCLISPGNRGFCLTRENQDGNLYTSELWGGIFGRSGSH